MRQITESVIKLLTANLQMMPVTSSIGVTFEGEGKATIRMELVGSSPVPTQLLEVVIKLWAAAVNAYYDENPSLDITTVNLLVEQTEDGVRSISTFTDEKIEPMDEGIKALFAEKKELQTKLDTCNTNLANAMKMKFSGAQDVLMASMPDDNQKPEAVAK